MRAVKVEYTVKPEYVATNIANIAKVMEELRSLGDIGIIYSTYVKEDGCSFVHFAIYRDDNSPNTIPDLQTFKAFQQQLRAEGLASQPQSANLSMVARSFDF